MEQRVLRASTLVVVCALMLRLLGAANLSHALNFTLSPEVASWMIFLQTGRLVQPSNVEFSPQATEPPPETTPETTPEPSQPTIPPQPVLPTFSPEQAKEIAIKCSFQYSADLEKLLTQPLSWDLTGEEPTVLILHSHGSESFAPTGEYKETSPYHTLNKDHNMISVGAYVAELLRKAGISVIQDTDIHDSPSYNAAYSNSLASMQKYLQTYPSIKLVLDLHRDSYEDANGNQIVHTVFSEGTTLAPLMFVVGTDYDGLSHPNWRENLALALKLQTQVEGYCPGICRKMTLRSYRYNQDLSNGAMLVEVGASGNTKEQALRAAEVLAKGIISLAHGSK